MSEMPAHHPPPGCPAWCALRHGHHPTQDEHVHVSGALMVQHTILRLCMTEDPGTDSHGTPYVLVGREVYSLHEAEALIDALTQLVDRAALSPRAAP